MSDCLDKTPVTNDAQKSSCCSIQCLLRGLWLGVEVLTLVGLLIAWFALRSDDSAVRASVSELSDKQAAVGAVIMLTSACAAVVGARRLVRLGKAVKSGVLLLLALLAGVVFVIEAVSIATTPESIVPVAVVAEEANSAEQPVAQPQPAKPVGEAPYYASRVDILGGNLAKQGVPGQDLHTSKAGIEGDAPNGVVESLGLESYTRHAEAPAFASLSQAQQEQVRQIFQLRSLFVWLLILITTVAMGSTLARTLGVFVIGIGEDSQRLFSTTVNYWGASLIAGVLIQAFVLLA